MSKITFCTLYPRGSAIEFYKDTGQIPETLGKKNDVNCSMVCCYASEEEAKSKGMHGFNYEQIPMVLNNQTITGLLYILKNAKKFDWFNFYHGGRHCYYWTRLYKFLNPNGKVYLKLDLSYEGCDMYEKDPKELRIFEKTARAADIVSVESEKIWELTRKFTEYPLHVIPNGYIYVKEELIEKRKREKKFITVGRLGTPPKATDILLEAYAKSADEHDWSLELVGSVEDSFKKEIELFYRKYPHLKERVVFTGPIYDRAKLYAEYRSARTFVLPSRWEAFPLVGPEALCNGCRMILSDVIPPIKELTNNGEFGTIVETGSVESLKNALVQETKRAYSDMIPGQIQEYARENLMWNSICEKLYRLMQKK